MATPSEVLDAQELVPGVIVAQVASELEVTPAKTTELPVSDRDASFHCHLL